MAALPRTAAPKETAPAALAPAGWAARYALVRGETEKLTDPLSAEDQTVQTMEDVSPSKWHLAHTSWFFETFLLKPFLAGYCCYDPMYEVLFNSYYQQIGRPYTRARRGLISRPGLAEVMAYRRHIDSAMARLMSETEPDWQERLILGLHHEQQHQELILTDIKHVLAQNPCAPPAYPRAEPAAEGGSNEAWLEHKGGQVEIGHQGEGFAFDNETPAHEILLAPFRLAAQPVSNRDYCAFMEEDGYQRPEFWLADGWNAVGEQNWRAPLYWQKHQTGWRHFTLAGEQDINWDAPVAHISYYEAAAYAAWRGLRLPREGEWELLARDEPVKGNLGRTQAGGSAPEPQAGGGRQFYGDVWEWTMSPYAPYPGFRAAKGAIGEYNGKFMCSQMVLRGGSCASAEGHIRASYRNFFPPMARWQFSGLRLAEGD